ncbi:alpha/beta hydrolase domain-containing protein [Lichenibacterium dinghuense]|uniref:alpha/beta hydrolase domain-containing protein n=1 Tax=Lichenibacterium dinghuense TaxID=2895977 RepID=UPI001F2A86F6|nr:alpha/beta hydrolase domain-containing protein [Lichenibacterium sp. 6Y81]
MGRIGRARLPLAVAAGALALAAGPASARIVALDIHRLPGLAFGGQSFGAVGPYEKWVGRATGAVDPMDPVDGAIADIRLAPRNAQGLVEYATPVVILRPADPSRGRHAMLFDLNNRGAVLGFSMLDDAAEDQNDVGQPSDVGNGFAMSRGYTMVWSGWDAVSAASPAVGPGPGAFLLDVPVARRPDGGPVVGPSLEEFVVDNDTTTSGPLTYPAADLDTAHATLTMRALTDDAPVALPASAWRFDPGTMSVSLLPEGTRFKAGEIYELSYLARDPKVTGLGFAAVRDVAAFLRGAAADDAGHANPLAGDIREVTTFCISQPCRMMRDFVRLGFNAVPAGKAIDGVLDWIGGGSGIDLDRRFAEPFRTHRQHIARHYPEFSFPFAYNTTTDAVTGRTDGLLARCTATNTCPKIIDVNSDNEYWAKSGSNLHTDAAGHDLADVPGVRLFLAASLPHGDGVPPHGKGICRVERNPLVANELVRALMVDLDAWVTDGVEPPASRVPRAAEGTLVRSAQADTGFPSIPGVAYNGREHTGDLLDFGPEAGQGVLTLLPPVKRGSPYPSLVPKTDADGNTLSGVRLPAVAVPTATYTGWNLRADDDGDGCDAAGMVVPFARTEAERRASGDPRPSLEARYPSHADYVAKVAAAAEALVEDRLLLLDDAIADVAAARASDVGR